MLLAVPAALPQAQFDVICAGEALALWEGEAATNRATSLALRPGGGAVNAAMALARREVRVALATILPDDRLGRALRARIEAVGVDVRAVRLSAPRRAVVLVSSTGAASELASHDALDEPLVVPDRWSSSVLLLSGLSPIVADAAALCRAARAARRRGSIVVVDINARWQSWAGRDARAVRMILREADVVRASTRDLSTLALDTPTLRSATRRETVLVVTNDAGDACATGTFGEVTVAGRPRSIREGDAFTASLCAALVRSGEPSFDRGDVWREAITAAD
jgi:2-dehydro-3-deoxygluconokinase